MTWAAAAPRPPAGCTRRCASWYPAASSKEITAAHAARVLEQLTPCGAVQQARWELAADLLDDLRRADERCARRNKKLTAAVQAAGTSLTEIFGVGPVIAATVIGEVA